MKYTKTIAQPKDREIENYIRQKNARPELKRFLYEELIKSTADKIKGGCA